MSKTRTPATPAPPTAAQIAARNEAALARVATMTDPDGLRNLMANARRMDAPDVRDAAFLRLAAVQAEGEATEGPVEQAIWEMVHAVEQIKREVAGKTIRLSYLRRDIVKNGAVPAAAKLVSKPGPSERFDELMARDLPGLTAEAIVLAHPEAFDAEARAAAAARMEGAGVDPATLAPASAAAPT
jgi:hypothetical protein